MTKPEEAQAFEEWVAAGVVNGWCSQMTCSTHEGTPSTDEETKAWEEGYDPCEFVLRLWPEDYRTQARTDVAMEANRTNLN